MKEVKFVNIQEWMLDYDFTTKELMTYAIIYGFSQDGKSAFYGGQEYIAKWTKSSVRQVQRVLDKLYQKGLLHKKTKFEDNKSYCVYKAIVKTNDKMAFDDDKDTTFCQKDTTFCQKDTTFCQKDTTFCQKTHDKMADNNKEIINLKERDNKRKSQLSSFNQEYVNQLFDKWSSYGFLNRGKIEFVNRFGQIAGYLQGIHSSDVFKAIDNYKKVKDSNGWYANAHNLTFESFCKKIQQFLEGNFDLSNFADIKDLVKYREQAKTEKDKLRDRGVRFENCPVCKTKNIYWDNGLQTYRCLQCQKVYPWDIGELPK